MYMQICFPKNIEILQPALENNIVAGETQFPEG